MKYVALTKYEFKEVYRNPGLWVLAILPVLMSKLIIKYLSASAPIATVLPTWVLFAEVMVGIMITAPNMLEERSSKTIDALLVTPVGFRGVLAVKGFVVLVLSLISQFLVIVLNAHGTVASLLVIAPILVGSILFIGIGMLVGLVVSSPKNGSALASALMILLFLSGAMSNALPSWNTALRFLPSVEVAANIQSVMQTQSLLGFDSVAMIVWLVVIGLLIELMVRRQR